MVSPAPNALPRPAAQPWRRGIAWLLILGPLFFISYGYSNQLAAQRAVSDSVFFAWERRIPFLPWTIVPYWSIDLLYGFAFLCCQNARAVDRLGLRLLTAQLISIAFFVSFPLRFAFDRPPSDGLFGALFDALTSFDQPYNQAPSLHIALLAIIWAQFVNLRTPAWGRLLIHGWALLIGVSVLTTWQHHFIDVPTGAAVGLLCLWIWPDGDRPTPLLRGADAGQLRIATYYAAGAGAFLMIALALGGVGLWLGWPALSLALVSCNYAWSGANGFQKSGGRHSFAVSWLLAPYLLGARINSRLWTRRHPQPDRISDDVWLGRMPNARVLDEDRFGALFDLAAELPAPVGFRRYDARPCLDMTIPDSETLLDAASRIETLRGQGDVLVACALGCSRSAAAVAAWLLLTKRVATVDEALTMLRRQRPQVVLGSSWTTALKAAAQLLEQRRHES